VPLMDPNQRKRRSQKSQKSVEFKVRSGVVMAWAFLASDAYEKVSRRPSQYERAAVPTSTLFMVVFLLEPFTHDVTQVSNDYSLGLKTTPKLLVNGKSLRHNTIV
jgi:hypothetical protein